MPDLTNELPPLPPYIYGREAGPNEKVWTESAVRELRAALASRQVPDEETVAWLHEDGDRVVTAATKAQALRDGGASASSMRPYSVALVAASPSSPSTGEERPVDMILYCPDCGEQHIDAPDADEGWTNPPHRSHKCHSCDCIWRPADVATNGVAALTTRGKADTWLLGDGAIPTAPASLEALIRACYDDAACFPEMEDPRTSDWMYDDNHLCAEAIRKRGAETAREYVERQRAVAASPSADAPSAWEERQEPAAWVAPNGEGVKFGKGWAFSPVRTAEATLPLYTHPASPSADARALLEQAREALRLALRWGDVGMLKQEAVTVKDAIRSIDAYFSTPASAAPAEQDDADIERAFADEQMRPGSGHYNRYDWFRAGAMWVRESAAPAAPKPMTEDELSDLVADASIDANLPPRFCLEHRGALAALVRASLARAHGINNTKESERG